MKNKIFKLRSLCEKEGIRIINGEGNKYNDSIIYDLDYKMIIIGQNRSENLEKIIKHIKKL